jgi:hypothetical protein
LLQLVNKYTLLKPVLLNGGLDDMAFMAYPSKLYLLLRINAYIQKQEVRLDEK